MRLFAQGSHREFTRSLNYTVNSLKFRAPLHVAGIKTRLIPAKFQLFVGSLTDCPLKVDSIRVHF